MVFRRYGTLNAASIPLTDGQTPPGDQLSTTDFLAQIQWLTKPAIVKPSLIDLKALQGDKAQAKAA
jgi:hypothetical protein